MLNPYRHYYLYSKYHYLRGDVFNDLRKIQADYCGMDEKYIKNRDIIGLLLEYIAKREEFTDFVGLVSNILYKHYDCDYDDPEERAIQFILRILRFTTVFKDGVELIELGEPDPNILPLKPMED